MRAPRRDDTLFLIRVPGQEARVPESLTPEQLVQQLDEARQLVASMRHLVKDALQTAHSFVLEASEGMEFDIGQVRSRMRRDGVKANLRSFRTGSLYKRSTQYDLLQRLDGAFDALDAGQEAPTTVMDEEED